MASNRHHINHLIECFAGDFPGEDGVIARLNVGGFEPDDHGFYSDEALMFLLRPDNAPVKRQIVSSQAADNSKCKLVVQNEAENEDQPSDE